MIEAGTKVVITDITLCGRDVEVGMEGTIMYYAYGGEYEVMIDSLGFSQTLNEDEFKIKL